MLAMSPTTNTSGCPGEGQVREHGDPAGAVHGGPRRVGQESGQWGGLDPCRPDGGPGVDPRGPVPLLDVHAIGVDADHLGPHAQFDSEMLERPGRLGGELIPERGQRLLAPVGQDHPDRRRIEGAELSSQTARRQFPHLTGQFDAGGAGADDDEGQPMLLVGRVGGHFSHFEGTEDAPPQLECIVQGLHPRGKNANSSCPKYDWVTPAATMRLS